MTCIQVLYTGPVVNRLDAILNNEKYYFTGKPCKNGHIDQRKVKNWGCLSCLKDKDGRKQARAIICGHRTKAGRNYCPPCRQKLYSETHHVPCETCGAIMVLSSSMAKKYKNCSLKCRNISISKRQMGEKSHLWRGGITEENRRIRNSARYDNWRRDVMKRDGYKCTICGATGRLCADHIKEWFLYPGLRFDLENGRTLCYPCHGKTETFGFKSALKKAKLEVGGRLQYKLL